MAQHSTPTHKDTKCLKVYANGLGRGEGTHVSVYAYLMRREFDDLLKWPFRDSVVF